MSGRRLKQLRLAHGWSLEDLAAEMGGVVSKQALGKYERDAARPTAVVLSTLAGALGVKAADLWSEPAIRVEFVGYRKGARLPQRERRRVESVVGRALEDRIRLQDLLNEGGGEDIPLQELSVETVEDAEEAADRVRDRWRLGSDPISSVVDVLESRHIHVIPIDAAPLFDGIAAIARDEEGRCLGGAVVSRRDVPGERQRLNLGHELGHLVLKVAPHVDEEKAAFRFGAAFLAPAAEVRRQIGSRRGHIELAELILLKRRFGLSLQAGLYRLKDLQIIPESHYKRWCIDVNRLGWRTSEPAELPVEEPQWLKRGVLRTAAEGLMAREEAERLLGTPLEGPAPRPLIERRAFLKLPKEERRRILAEQAEAISAHYEQDTEWRELETEDFLDD